VLQQQLVEQQRARSCGGGGFYTSPFVPCLSRSLAGFYTGVLRLVPPADGDDDDLSVTGLLWGECFSWYVDPRQVGSPHVLFNQAHNMAAVLQPLHGIRFPRPDGTRTAPQMLLHAVQRSAALGEQQRQRQVRQQAQGAGLVELTWNFQATSSNPADPLLKVKCLCESCARAKKPRMLVVMRRA
jgi:hypothetical protein